MVGQAEISVCENEPILHSSYPSVAIPTLTTKSAYQLILEAIRKHAAGPLRPWITDHATGARINFQDIEALSNTAAAAMAKRGMVKGDVAMYMTMDVSKIFTTIMGIWRLGGVVYSSYPEDTQDTLLKRIVDSKAKWVFCDPMSVAQVKVATQKLDWQVEIIVFGQAEGCTSMESFYAEADVNECPPPVQSELADPLLILCTSGTTGKSKGAIYTNWQTMAFCMGTNGIPNPGDSCILLLLRCTHVLGCLFPLRNAVVGIHSIMMSAVNKINIFEAVHIYRPILAFGFPTFMLQMVIDPEAKKYDFSSLTSITCGGIVLTKKVQDLLMTLPGMRCVLNGYGMTECAALTTTINLAGSSEEFTELPNTPPLSVGKLYPNTSLKILDIDNGRALGPNQRGEIAIRSPILCNGYWNMPDESAETFKGGWMRTGDLGYYDENGFIFVVDRIKETFKYFNNHISPAELEEVILAHPAVAESCCFGIPDPEGGDRIPRAVAVLRPNASVTAEELLEFVDKQVAPFKKIRGGLFIVPQLPKGNTGKVVRSAVASMPLPLVI